VHGARRTSASIRRAGSPHQPNISQPGSEEQQQADQEHEHPHGARDEAVDDREQHGQPGQGEVRGEHLADQRHAQFLRWKAHADDAKRVTVRRVPRDLEIADGEARFRRLEPLQEVDLAFAVRTAFRPEEGDGDGVAVLG
jgi:hypothetical protein